MPPDQLPDYCLYFHWGAFRFSLTSKPAIVAWATLLGAICTGALSWHKLLSLL
jgi:hypothetical protein